MSLRISHRSCHSAIGPAMVMLRIISGSVLPRFVVGICLLMSPPAFCQAGVTIMGLVKDPQEASIAGASVRLVTRDNTSSRKALTDSSGHYLFEHVTPGGYLLEASRRILNLRRQRLCK